MKNLPIEIIDFILSFLPNHLLPKLLKSDIENYEKCHSEIKDFLTDYFGESETVIVTFSKYYSSKKKLKQKFLKYCKYYILTSGRDGLKRFLAGV